MDKRDKNKSQSIQEKMLSNIGDVIVVIDKDGVTRFKSPSVKKHFGWEVDDFIGRDAFEKVHPDDIDQFM